MSWQPVPYRKLIDYAAGDLPPEERLSIERHLAIHPDAAEIVARYRLAVQTMQADGTYTAPPEVVKRAQSVYERAALEASEPRPSRLELLIAALIHDNRVHPAALGVRGTGGSIQLAYACRAALVDLHIEPVNPEDADVARTEWRLVGQITNLLEEPPPERAPADHVPADQARAGSIRVAIFPRDVPSASALHELDVDEGRAFSVKLVHGRYELHCVLANRQVVIPDLTIP